MKRERRGIMYALHAASDWLDGLDRVNYTLMTGLLSTGFGLLILAFLPILPFGLIIIVTAGTGLIAGWGTWQPSKRK